MFPEAVLEQCTIWQEPIKVLPVSEVLDERQTLDQTIRFAGSVLVERAVELEEEAPVNSLMEALKLASQGDETAVNLVRADVATDLMERTIKAGFVSTSRMEINADGQLVQYGQSYRSVQANSLRYSAHPVMRERVWAETKNYFRLEKLINEQLLDEYSFVVFSMAERDMPEHFYSDTNTLAIQVSRRHGDELVTETAFVAGKDETGLEHDREVVSRMYAQLLGPEEGEEVAALNNAEIIDRPLLVHNSLLENGAVDLVKLYDDLNGGTFYGQKRPRQDYLAHKEECKKQALGYKETCDQVSAQLIDQSPNLDTPLKASMMLDQLSRAHSLKMAVGNAWIDPQVFGAISADHIRSAREALSRGDQKLVDQSLSQAWLFDTSTSCPGAASSLLSRLGLNGELDQSSGSDENATDKYGSLSFYCPKGHLNTRTKNHLIERCKVCKISVKCS